MKQSDREIWIGRKNWKEDIKCGEKNSRKEMKITSREKIKRDNDLARMLERKDKQLMNHWSLDINFG